MAEPRYYVPDEDTREFKVFVAIDLGTTYSACSLAIGREDEVRLASKKIPTAVMLDSSTQLHAFGKEAMQKYFELEEDEEDDWYYFDRFKMKLHNDKAISADMMLKDINGRSLPARIVFGRALKHFRDLAIKGVDERALAGCHEEEIKWILTVPAIWGDRAKEFMKKAAEEAGMDPTAVDLAYEPEGAAFRCRDDISFVHQRFGCPDTLRYIVADCGGGTIDVTVHDLNMITKTIKEVHCATGGDWGGTMVDKKLRELMQRIIGEDVAAKIQDKQWLQFSRENMEEAKRTAGDLKTDAFNIRLTREILDAIRDAGGNLETSAPRVRGAKFHKARANLIIDRSLMAECFHESLTEIAGHINTIKDLVQGVQCILVVGGYAESDLLMDRLEAEFQSSECRVVRPRWASEAIVFGACLIGQRPTILESRKSKLTYGVKSAINFNPLKHDPERMALTPSGLLCLDTFNVYVTTNESVRVGSVVEKQFTPVTPNQTEFHVELYCTPDADVKYVDEAGSTMLGCLKIYSEDTSLGLNRIIVATINFSATSLIFKAYMKNRSGDFKKLPCKFECL